MYRIKLNIIFLEEICFGVGYEVVRLFTACVAGTK